MWVAVIGSCPEIPRQKGWSINHKEQFERACRAIGALLAADGHRLVVAHTDRDTADKFAKLGFEERNRELGQPSDIYFTEYPSKVWAQAHLRAVTQADAVVAIGGADGTYTAAQAALLSGKRLIPISCFGGAAASIPWSDYLARHPLSGSVRRIQHIKPTEDDHWITELTGLVHTELAQFPSILVIHGRAHDRADLETILRNIQPRIPDPIVMKYNAVPARSIPDLFARLANEVDAAIAVVSPDDVGTTVVDRAGQPLPFSDSRTRQLHLRARQNVWVEVGWFWGRLGLDRIMLLQRGADLEIPSDLQAMVSHQYQHSPNECEAEIRSFVEGIRHRN